MTASRKVKPNAAVPPDWQTAAIAMDATIPSTTPVAEALLSRLPDPESGARVIDLACGTGHPTLVLARSRPDLEIIGVDSTPAMIERARQKSAEEGLNHVLFDVMSLESLELPNAHVDAVISQFGLLQHGDPTQAAGETARVLRPKGHFSIAVWDHMSANTFVSTLYGLMTKYAPAGLLPDFSAANALAVPGVRERHLRRAGICEVETGLFDYSITMPNFDAVARGLQQPATFGPAFASLSEARQDKVRHELRGAVERYAHGDTYVFPVTCRLYWGQR